MKSKVWFLPWTRRDELYAFLKKARVFDHVKARQFLALKMHFGEEGNAGYVKPEQLTVYDVSKRKLRESRPERKRKPKA